MLKIESTAHLPPVELLENYLKRKIKVVTKIYPQMRISYWDVYYDPDSRGLRGEVYPWVARTSSKMYQSDTLEHLLNTLRKQERDDLEWRNQNEA